MVRIVSGMRPTGSLHLGHYFGVIKNWLEIQDKNESFFFVADWHDADIAFFSFAVLNNQINFLFWAKVELGCDWGVGSYLYSSYFQDDISGIEFGD